MIQCDWGAVCGGVPAERARSRRGRRGLAGVGEVCGNPVMAHVPDHQQTPPANSPRKPTPLGLSYPSCKEPLSVQPHPEVSAQTGGDVLAASAC